MTQTLSAESLSLQIAEAASDKKAEDITILDLRGVSTFTDFFVLCSGTSEPHLKAIGSEIRSQMREKWGQRPTFSEGLPASHWVVLDYADVLVHIFTAEKRAFYALESLWGDAKRVAYPPAPAPAPVPEAAVKPEPTKAASAKAASAKKASTKTASTKTASTKAAAAKKASTKAAAAKRK